MIASRTFSNINRLFLEFDHYDFHFINKEAVLNNPFVWKANLLGGGRIVELVERIYKLPTLKEYLEKKQKENNWVFGDGFIKGKKFDSELVSSDFEKKKGGYSKASFLTDSLCFDPFSFDENGITSTYKITDVYFQWPRNKELFQGPLLLIKKNIGTNSIPVIILETGISFKNEIIGIHAPINDVALLKKIEKTLKNNNLYRFYLISTSPGSGISKSKSTLLQKDILGLPYSEFGEQSNISLADNILIQDVK